MKEQVAAELYIDLMKRIVCNTIYRDQDLDVSGVDKDRAIEVADGGRTDLRKAGARVVDFDPEGRTEGRHWPSKAHTMIGTKRIDNLIECTRRVLDEGIPGDFLEAGVWRGGACILMRAVLAAHGDTSRCVWAADSFEGLPEPGDRRYPEDHPLWGVHMWEQMAVPLEEVRENFRRYGLLDEQVKFLKGSFSETLPTAEVEELAVLRSDGDLYESTMETLVSLYPKLSPGGFVIVDDYALEVSRKAVHDFREKFNVSEPISKIDWTGIFWRKEN